MSIMKHARQSTCHPERKHLAKGLCVNCYYSKTGPGYKHRLKYQNSEKFKETRRRNARAPHARKQRAKRRREIRYGITNEQYEALQAAQDGGCAICHEPCSTGRRLSVDHAHTDNCDWRVRKGNDNHCSCPIRGLLCQSCNAAIGRFRVRPPTPSQALYLGSTNLTPVRSHCANGHPYPPILSLKPGGGIYCSQCNRDNHAHRPYNPETRKLYRETHREQIKRWKHEAYLRKKAKSATILDT